MGDVKSSKGGCILCGGEKQGAPAIDDVPILAIRSLRRLFRMSPKHTICCGNCLPLCREKRARFEKTRLQYGAAACLFFVLAVAGSVLYRSVDARIALPVLFGCAIIFLFSYGSYFPAFEGKTAKR